MMAHDMDDPEFTTEVLSGKKSDGSDVHSKNVIRFGLDPKDPKARDGQAKPGVYAMIYGGGDEKLGHTVDVFGKPEAWYFHEKKQRMVDGTAEAFGRAMRYSFLTALPKYATLCKRVKDACKKGWIRGIDGRKLFVRSDHSALNTRFQANGNIAVKVATIKWDAECRKERLDSWMVLHYHDEIGADSVDAETAARSGELWQRSVIWAGKFLKFKVPLGGSWSTGSDWSIH